ncbi:MAG: ATP-binding cassette domain-containing protein [Candidatus Coatesbacteria bacterium]|nr:ATP-binding cassette domain-containing protein [Candidatus Coatesbacteria bacterium]
MSRQRTASDELPALRLETLSKTYPGGLRRKAVEAVRGVEMRVHPGEVVALLGPNGAGKTTLIKMVCGLLLPTAGRIHIGPYDLERKRSRALARLAVVLEGDRNLRFRLNVRENILFFASLVDADLARVRSEFPAVLERFGLDGEEKTQARNLSKGQRQKLSLAIAYLTRAGLMLLDEPTLGLDVEASRELQRIIRDTADSGRAVLVTTHEMHVAQRIADRVAIINQGRLVTLKPVDELLELFRFRSYTVRLRVEDGPPPDPEALGARLVESRDGYLELELETDDRGRLFALLDALRSSEAEILEIARRQPDLERVFLEIIADDGRDEKLKALR